MVTNPFAEGVSVNVNGDTSGAQSALANLQGELGLTRKRAAALGGVMAGALASAGLGAAINAASDFEDAMVEVQKVTDEQTAEDLAGPIREMAEEIPIAQNELAGLTADAARFGIEGTENIQQFAETAAQMGFATDLAANEAGEALARLATLTDTPTEEINNLGSAIAVLGNNFATSEQEIVDSMLRSSAAMGSLGLNRTEMAGLSTALNEVSESSQRAGSRLRRLAQELMDPGKVEDLSSALGMTEEEFRQMRESDPSELMQTMAESFAEGGDTAENLRGVLTTTSQQAVAGLSQNLDGLTNALDKSNSGYEEATALQEETDAQTETFSSQVQLLRNELTNVGITIGEVLLPHLIRLTQALSTGVEAFSRFNERTNGVAGAIGLIVTAIGGFATAGAILVSSLGGVTAILGALGTAFAVLTGPVGIAIAAIAALAIAWNQNLGGIQTKTTNMINAVMSRMQPFIDLLREELVMTLNHWRNVTNDVLSVMQKWWGEHGDAVMSVINPLINVLEEVLVGALDTLVSAVRVGLAILRGDFEGAFGIIENYLERRVERYKTIGENLIQALINGIKAVAPNLGDTVENVMQDIRDKLPGSDAKEGPLSDLTASARAIGETFEANIGLDASNMVDGSLPTPNVNTGNNQTQPQEVVVILEEDTENLQATVQSTAEGVVTEQKREVTRNTGGTTGL